MRIVEFILHAIDSFQDRFGRIIAFLTVGMMGVVAVEVVLRYVFDSPTLWAHETAQFLYGAYCILGGAYVLLHKGHVSMDIIYVRLSLRKRAILDLFTSPLVFLYLGMMLWHGSIFAWKSVGVMEVSTTSWAPPIWPIKLILPLAALLFLLQGIVGFVRDLTTAVTGRESISAANAKKEIL
jgi:TRAP-type mannitol/chloroaromatic compound transport system permease small subunit